MSAESDSFGNLWSSASKPDASTPLSADAHLLLYESVELLRTLIEHLPGGAVFVVDPNLRYRLAGGEAITHLGMKPDDFVGKSLVEALGPELTQQYEPHYRQAFGGTPFFVEHESYGRYFLTHGIPLRDAANTVCAVMAVSYDITDRKQREVNQAFLADITDEFSQLLSVDDIMQTVGAKIGRHMKVISCVFTDVDETQRKQLTVSHGWVKTGALSIVGNRYRIEEYLTLEFERACRAGETFAVNDTQNDPRTDATGYANAQIGSFVVMPFHRDGKWRHYLTIYDAQPRNWYPDEIELFRELANRIFPRLERARTEAALRQSEEQLRIVLDSITEHALITTDIGGLITGWNPGAQQLFGWTADEVIGQSSGLTFTPEDRIAGEPEHEMATARKQGKAVDERYHLRKDGSRFYVSGVMSPLYDAAGQLLGYVKVDHDLTERRQMEQALHKADQRKDEFLAMLAHELRNPLTPIRNLLQLLQLTGQDDETIGPAVALMSRQVDHLVRLIDDLLDVSRISRGKIELRRERLDLTALIRQATEAARPLYESRHRRLQVSLPPSPIYLQGDATRLTQVVTNLLTNGTQYTHENGHVSLTMEEVDEPLGHRVAVLRVCDDGIGLAPDQIDQIFELFVQIDTSLGRSQGGLGVGLALVRQLVNMHGGRVEAYSGGPGQGSEFIVTLPILQESNKPISISKETLVTGTPGHQILVVDDNRDAADTLTMLLRLKKHQVHVCYSGREAVEAVQRLQPKVVLLDISMPELDGYATCRLLRQQPDGNDRFLVALTGYGQEEDKLRSIEAGFNRHLVKPVDLNVLTRMLDDLSL